MSQPSLAIRIEDFPKHLHIPFQKSDVTSAIAVSKKQKKELGVNNYPVSFSNGRNKATVIFLETFSEQDKQNLLSSKFMDIVTVLCQYY